MKKAYWGRTQDLSLIKRTYIDRNITASDHWPLWMEMDTENKN